jgi:hypothetical protein
MGIAALALTVVPLYVANCYLEKSYMVTGPAESLVAAERAQEFNSLNPRIPEREAELAVEIGDWDRAQGAYEGTIGLNREHYAA